LPRFSLLNGIPCHACHVNFNGGGQRNNGGWNGIRKSGLIDPKGTFLSPIYGAESNTLFDERLTWGFDIRQQLAKRYIPSERKLKRQFFTMQIQPYLTYRPYDQVAVSASYNFVPPVYPEQQRFTCSVTYQPVEEAQVQAGYFLPDFGIQHDDHTVLTRGAIAMRRMYQELGAQIAFTPLEWLTVSSGVFSSQHRQDAIYNPDQTAVIGDKSLMGVGKLSIQPTDYELGISFLAGGSILRTDGQTILGVHTGVALIDQATLLLEFVTWTNRATVPGFEPSGKVFSVLASYQIIEGLAFTARYEEATVDVTMTSTARSKQYIAGLETFILPFFEIRPEYRYTDSPIATVAQYSAQIHIFY